MQAVLATLTTTSGSGIRSITAMPPYRGALGDSADAYSQEAAVGPFRPFRAVSPEHASLLGDPSHEHSPESSDQRPDVRQMWADDAHVALAASSRGSSSNQGQRRAWVT
jgi:hypothetical protein